MLKLIVFSNLVFYSLATRILVDDSDGLGLTFDGIGGVSGGGATSKLLVNYPEKQRNEILDILFKPKHVGSLQILKVEIGGDSQSTDGSESSHMHDEDDENYNRGYEWWLMKEVKKRNPDIKLYGLPWVFPGWLAGEDKSSPYHNVSNTVRYVMNWIKGAKEHHGLHLDYIGVWNERPVSPEYVKLLKKTMVKEGYGHIQIVSPDAMSWSILDDFKKDKDYLDVVDIIGQHYPGSKSREEARKYNKRYWSSEDYSTPNDLRGAGCWARLLNEGVVLGNYTSYIAWNLITSYYDGLPYSYCSLMTANQPWSGHYRVDGPIWISGHHTNFYTVGDSYLPHGKGVGQLEGGGYYISVTNQKRDKLTIVLETIRPKDGRCLYPAPEYDVTEVQKVNLMLEGSFKGIKQMHMWSSRLHYDDPDSSKFMSYEGPTQVVGGQIEMILPINTVITLTTEEVESPHIHTIPPSSSFSLPYFDNFEGYSLSTEPYNLAQQMGSFEVTLSSDSSHKNVMTQMVTSPPVDTCWTPMPRPFVLVGDRNWLDTRVNVEAYIDGNDVKNGGGVFVASQVDKGGCDGAFSAGVHFFVDAIEKRVFITTNHNRSGIIATAFFHQPLLNKWFHITLDVTERHVTAYIDHLPVLAAIVPRNIGGGFVTFGPLNFGKVSFDNLLIERALLPISS